MTKFVPGEAPVKVPGDRTSRVVEYLLTHYRGLFATLVLLPVSALYAAYVSARERIVFALKSAPAKHDQKVRRVIEQIEAWKRDGCREKLCTARSGWKAMSELVPKYKLTHRNIDVGLYDILEIDEQRSLLRVEPLATMGQISRTLVARGWTLPVVPELDDLTVGGLIMGFGVESSSHKYGLIQHICASFDIVTAEGKLLRCSPSENADLYDLIPWSHGTLGFLVAAELKIIPAQKYVRLHYRPVYSLDEMVDVFEAESRDTEKNDFVEGLVYTRDQAVILYGSLAGEAGADGPVNAIGRWYKPWFYKHAESYLTARKEACEYVPLRDYFHRHTRSYFWAMEEIISFGNHPVFRWLLGWALPPRIELLKYTETETTRRLRERHHVVQDMLMPIRYLAESIRYFDEHFRLYPLWLSPMAVRENECGLGFIHPFRDDDGVSDDLYVDVGAYGTPQKEGFDNAHALPLLEKFVLEHRGYQALYARTTLSRKNFRAMFDHKDYDRLRERLPYCKQAFDEVYDKVSLKGRTSPVELRRMAKAKPRSRQ
ncbi:lipid biosynthetic enzyme, related to human 24-dehydrocholesterol reductase DHCR [Methylocaldum marinum]|uniref:Delta(24)-sterol reductase n=1 Tax=Methylocaldum marinum TaxID=1432792 RepID=A0A250KS93_9GAMM|nr:FAD-binding oxidoreductase [Methylocaldum marinum]BBA34530.1 lipid biosynthetic enzyme, related to human 24-dehydrocholesterol reductase DHCR [Methylocaldum marinum]